MGFLATALTALLSMALFDGFVGSALLISYYRFSKQYDHHQKYKKHVIYTSLNKVKTERNHGTKHNRKTNRAAQ